MARPTNKLSVKFTEKPNLKPGLYGDGGGLYLQVSDFKTKAWVFRYMVSGRARKMGLGDFELVSLKDARKKRDAAYGLVVDGVDPIEERKARKTEQAVQAAKSLTFKEAAERYIEANKAGWKSEKHAGQWSATLVTYAYKKIGHLPVSAIDVGLVLQVLEQKTKKGDREGELWNIKTETASRVRGRIETVLSWAKSRGFRQGDNPAAWALLQFSLPKKSRVAPVKNQPALPYAQIPAFMKKLRAKDGTSARALEFLILTGARTSDVTRAPWDEINTTDRLWTIPASRLKGKKDQRKHDHVVPLSAQALAILETFPKNGSFIFPGGKAGKPLSDAAMAAVIDRMNEENGAAELPKWIDPKDRREIVPHGFRSTFMDWGHDVGGYPKEMMDMATAHVVKDKVEAAYRRGNMLDRRRRLMADWAVFCAGKAIGGNNVVKIGARK